jgi:hypothetical protein
VRGTFVLCGAALAAALANGVAAAAPPNGTLPSPTTPVRLMPPLRVAVSFAGERRFPKHVASIQQVRTEVDREGRSSRVVVLDRLLVRGTGDYSLTIPAPAEDVVAAAGSESQPGLREGAVLWQGFSTRRRNLAALITLRTQAAAKALPIRLVRGDDGVLRLENATDAPVEALASRAPPAAVARALDDAYRAVSRGRPATPATIPLSGPLRTRGVVGSVPLRISGTYRLGDARRVHLRTVVGGRRLALGKGELRALDLAVGIPDAAQPLRPPRGRTWLQETRRRAFRRDAVAVAVDRLLAAALATQYHSFLANPDPGGAVRTSYRFVLGAAPRPAVQPHREGSDSPWLAVGIALALGLAAVGGVVLWAHS